MFNHNRHWRHCVTINALFGNIIIIVVLKEHF
jgi:hypothetical protein